MLLFRILLFVSILLLPVARFPSLGDYIEPVRFWILFFVFFLWVAEKISSEGQGAFWGGVKAHPLNGWIVILLIWLVSTTIVADHLEISIPAAVTHGFILLYYYLFADVLLDRTYRRRLLLAFLVSGMFVCIIALLQYLVVQGNMLTFLERWIVPRGQRVLIEGGESDLMTDEGYRSMGTLFHPNSLGVYLALVLPFTMTIAGIVRDWKKRLLCIVCSVLLALGLFCAGSRGSILSVLISGIFLVAVFWRRIPRGAFLVGALVFALVGMAFSDKIMVYMRLEQGLSSRDVLWERAVEIFEGHPWVGIGPGAFPTLFVARYGFSGERDLILVLSDWDNEGNLDRLGKFTAHNLFLNYAVEMGLFAAILAFVFYFIYFWKVFWYCRRAGPSDDPWRYMMLAATAAVAGNLAQAFFEASINFWNIPLGLSFALVVSLGLVSMREEGRCHYDQARIA